MSLHYSFSTPTVTLTLLTIVTLLIVPSSSSDCNSSTETHFYRSIISKLGSTSSPYQHALYAVNRSLEKAKSTTDLLTQAGALTGKVKAYAIDVCLELAEMSVDDLETALTELARGEPALTREDADHVRMHVSAAMTNADTCLKGLEEDSSRNSRRVNESMHEISETYDVALTLVARAMDKVERKWSSRSPKIVPAAKLRAGVLINIIDTIPANQTVTVAQNGTRDFSTIMEAVNNASVKHRNGYFKIVIKEGVYYENVLITKNKTRLIIVGAGINQTVITGNRSVGNKWPTTYGTATFAVHGVGFIAYNLTFENTAGPDNKQAVAVRNDADYSVFYKCSFLGYQDTLYVHHYHQFYRDCDIYGTVDFIFGDAAAVFQNCNIYARKPLWNQKNTVTAQSRICPGEHTGISIHNCSILAAPDLDMNSTKTYLGRPWQKHSRTVFMQSYIGSHIDPKGWLEWNGTVGLDTLYYGEYENYGPGNCTTGRVKWPGVYKKMNESDAYNFTVSKFIFGESWLKNISIPFVPGLLPSRNN